MISHSFLPVSCSVSLHWWPLNRLTRATGVKCLFKVASIASFEGWRSVSYQIPLSTAHSPSWCGKSPKKITPAMPFSLISTFIFVVAALLPLALCCLGWLFICWRIYFSSWDHLSHLSRLHSRILKQQIWQQSCHMCGLVCILFSAPPRLLHEFAGTL